MAGVGKIVRYGFPWICCMILERQHAHRKRSTRLLYCRNWAGSAVKGSLLPPATKLFYSRPPTGAVFTCHIFVVIDGGAPVTSRLTCQVAPVMIVAHLSRLTCQSAYDFISQMMAYLKVIETACKCLQKCLV